MHKLIVTLRKVAGVEEATVEAAEVRYGDEDLIFVVGPKAAGFAVKRVSQAQTFLQKMSAGR